jgi:UDP:flavonoid glycosyltransferase YjiC (YdhE family)
MSRILVVGDGGFLSHVSRPLEIAKQLKIAGHEVSFAASGSYAKLASDAGFTVRPIYTVPQEHILSRSRLGRADWYTPEHVRLTVEADRAAFEQVQPDLVLGDFRHSLRTSCELARLPFAAILNASWTNYYSIVYRAPEHLFITRLLGKTIATKFSPLVKAAILSRDAAAHNQYRRQVGLEPLGNVWDVFSGDLNLLTDIPEYGPTRNLPSNFHYVGPLIWEPDVAVPEWIHQLDPNRPTIYFTMGSTGHAKYLQVALDLFADSEYQCLMTTAGLLRPAHVPRNFFVCDYAPGSELMKRSALVVCQGGNGTIYQAMQHSVPVIGIPTMHDQEFNMQRVTDMGFGVELSDLRFKPEHLTRAVRQVLDEASFSNAARQYQKILAPYDGPRTAARVIGDFLGGSPAAPAAT